MRLDEIEVKIATGSPAHTLKERQNLANSQSVDEAMVKLTSELINRQVTWQSV